MSLIIAPAFDASVLLSELPSLVGTEMVMLCLGLLTYILFSGQNMLIVCWSYVSAWLLPLNTVAVAPSTMACGFAASTGDHQAKKMIDSETEEEERQDNINAPEEDDGEWQEQQQQQKISTAPA